MDLSDPDKLSPITVIAISEARDACKGEPDIELRLLKAMAVCHDHWMEHDERKQFLAAISAVYLESTPDERRRIEASAFGAFALRRLQAALEAIQLGIDIDFSSLDTTSKNLIPLARLWSAKGKGK